MGSGHVASVKRLFLPLHLLIRLTFYSWRMTWFGKVVTQNTVWGLEKLRMVPKGTHDVGESLKTAGALLACPFLLVDSSLTLACSLS